MNSLNINDPLALRKPALMAAYLKNEASLEEIEKIEALMEADPMYRLAMDEMAEQMARNPGKLVETPLNFAEFETGQDN